MRQADEAFAASQRGGTTAGDTAASAPTVAPAAPRANAPAAAATAGIGPDYSAAIARYEELVTRYPTFEQIDAAAYTLGTLYAGQQRWADATRMFERVAATANSPFRAEALFRLGDARFELASRERGERRRALFASASTAYEQAAQAAPPQGDIYFLSLYKLGWAYYNQATQTTQQEYQKAVDVLQTLVDAYDKLSAEQQARLGLRGEVIEYMAIAFTQVGGSEKPANRYFASHGGAPYRTTIYRRVAQSLRDQGNFPEAIRAYQVLLTESPTDSSVLNASSEIVDIYQNRMIEPDSAQVARMQLADVSRLVALGRRQTRRSRTLPHTCARKRCAKAANTCSRPRRPETGLGSRRLRRSISAI